MAAADLSISVRSVAVSVLPLREKPLIATPLFDDDERPSEFPIFIEHDDKMFSFADLRNFEEFCRRRGFLDKLRQLPLRDFLAEVDNRSLKSRCSFF